MTRGAHKTFAEFFAGVGLVRLGLSRAGWECVFANDIDKTKAAIYKNNFEGNHFVLGDVRHLKPSQIPPCALATASFPCTDISLAGARRGIRGKQSGAFFGFASRLAGMRSAKPKLLLLENVPGLLTVNGGKDIHETLKTLNELGYGVDMFVMDARWFTPQSRPRLFVVGVHGAGRKGDVAGLTGRDEKLRPKTLVRVASSLEDIKWALNPIPAPPRNVSIKLRDIIEDVPDENFWPGEEVENLLRQMSEKNISTVKQSLNSKSWVHATVFRRVRKNQVAAEPRFDGVAGCLRTPRGGSSRQILLRLGYGRVEARYLTAREYGRLQGAPDDFVIPPRQNAGLFAFGDAVCVPVIQWIGENVLNHLA
ncbi:MAG: DNA (cytosine-5-)-methyltransferase [Nitrospinae bacterium]|nr:DNA (cytosine-5-)-methyltransferase [Nitrospinota bacterium]